MVSEPYAAIISNSSSHVLNLVAAESVDVRTTMHKLRLKRGRSLSSRTWAV